MNKVVEKCPVKHLIQFSEPSRCPVNRMFSWFKARVSFITDKIPLQNANKERETFTSASCVFAEALLEHHFHIDYVLRHALCTHIHEGAYESRNTAIEQLFIRYGDSSNGIVSDTLLDAMSALEQKYQAKFQAAVDDPLIYSRIAIAYPFGVQVVHDIWRNLLRAFNIRYDRFPTPEESKSFRKFITDFTLMIGKSPALFAVSIRELLVKASSKPPLIIDEEGHIDFQGSKERGAMQLTDIELNTTGGKSLLEQKITNGFCPALPFIPKITEMCCGLLEGAYEEIYNLPE